ncbi:MAG: rod shape-determining protein MreD [Clostridiales bacterium]|nr:rod shape-determining protein MreD [Clostridiales bacterium]
MKLVKNIKYILSVLFALLIDFTMAKYLKIGGAMPQLMFCFCIMCAVFEREFSYVCAAAIAAGATADMLSGHGFGTYTLTFCLSALVTFAVRDKTFSSKALFSAVDVFVLTVLSQLIYYLFHINDAAGSFWRLFTSVILSSALYNCVVCMIFFRAMRCLFAERR